MTTASVTNETVYDLIHHECRHPPAVMKQYDEKRWLCETPRYLFH